MFYDKVSLLLALGRPEGTKYLLDSSLLLVRARESTGEINWDSPAAKHIMKVNNLTFGNQEPLSEQML